jgi:pimeloyl-ACP methyl ester carboxylesterase
MLLHGFPQTSHTWRDLLPALADAGYHALAPNQRGYSPGARPGAVADYAANLLVADALALADACGAQRFHLVGHDWGGQIAWLTAAWHPERVRTLTVLSRPHPAAFAAAMQADAAQAERSRHHRAFLDPATAGLLLADDALRLRRMFADQGVPPAAIDAYLERLGDAPTLEAALNWYRAAAKAGPGLAARDIPAVTVPTLYLWGSADATVGRIAAEATAAQVTGPYRFEIIAGAGHFLTDDAGPAVVSAVLRFLGDFETAT